MIRALLFWTFAVGVLVVLVVLFLADYLAKRITDRGHDGL